MQFKWPQHSEVLWWAVICLLFALLLFVRVAAQGVLIEAGWPTEALAKAVGATLLGAALWFEQHWAKWLGSLLAGGLVALTCWHWSQGAFSWMSVFGALLLGLAIWQLWQLPLGADKESPFLSLVLLVRKPPSLDRVQLARLASRAWGMPVAASDLKGDFEEAMQASRPSVFGESPELYCKHPQALLRVSNSPQPYFDNPAEVADDIHELRAKQAILEHQAWVSVDVAVWFGDDDFEEAYRIIAALLAELADEHCLAVIDPNADQLFVYDPETDTRLRSRNPLSELRKVYYDPIVTVSDDPRLREAVREARERFPEFTNAFHTRDPYDDAATYMVKAPFRSAGETEFMWLEVEAIENDVIYGLLRNDPARITDLAEGDRVKVRIVELNDWMYVINDEPTGAFTMKLLRDQM